jgi:hypothetical protein
VAIYVALVLRFRLDHLHAFVLGSSF